MRQRLTARAVVVGDRAGPAGPHRPPAPGGGRGRAPAPRRGRTARAGVVGGRGGTVVPGAVVDVVDGRIAWAGPAADAPPARDAEGVALPGRRRAGAAHTRPA